MRRLKASEGAKTARLSESETDLIILCPNRFKDNAGKGVLASAKVVDFKTVLEDQERFGDAEFSVRSIANGDELAR